MKSHLDKSKAAGAASQPQMVKCDIPSANADEAAASTCRLVGEVTFRRTLISPHEGAETSGWLWRTVLGRENHFTPS